MRRAVLRLEYISENLYAYQHARTWLGIAENAAVERYRAYLGRDSGKPGVWQITGFGLAPDDDALGIPFQMRPVSGQIDYSQANSVGSRGVYLYYALTPGAYLVHERTSWRHTRTYYLLVEDEMKREVTREEVVAWLQDQ